MKKHLSISYILLVATLLISSCRKWDLEKVELLPTVKTTSTTNIALTTATVGGIFEIVGSQTIDEYGHCWSETPNATIANARNTQTERKKVGDFSSELTNLKANTTYFVRAYTKIGDKIVYAGNEINFKTLRLPSIEITESRDITSNNAKIFVNFTDFGNPNATVYGLCWATTSNPNLASTPNRTTINVSNMGTLQTEMSNLQLNTTYYVRAYATNAVGTAYSSKDFILQTSCSLAELALQNTVLNIESNSATLTVSSVKMNCDKLSTLDLQYGTEANFNGSLRISNISSSINSPIFLQNLLPNTTYFARIYAANSVGISFSNVVSFKTPCALPTLITQNVSNITTNTAFISTIVSQINCTSLINSGFSLATNSAFSNATNFSNASNNTSFNQTFTNLSPNTTYFVRSYATNLAGIVYSATQSFTTIAILPVGIQTINVTNISSVTATLNGNISNLGNSNSIVVGFLISSTSQIPLIGGSGVSNIGLQTRTSTGSFSTIANLQSGLTYYFRAYSTNASGTSYGDIQSFTTVALPTVSTLAATNITLNSANLQGSLQNLGNVSTVSIGFVIASANQNPLIGGTNVTNISLGNATSNSNISSIINNLQEGTTYYFRIYATNSAGTNYGQVLSFSTLSLPTITTLATTNITSSSATFNLNLTSLGSNASVNTGFVFSTSNTNPTIGNTSTIQFLFPNLSTNIGTQSTSITNLQANTTYYIRAYTSTNAIPVVYGQVLSFMTSTSLSVTTLATTSITSNSAIFNLNLTSLGSNTSVNTGFVFSTSNQTPVIGSSAVSQYSFPNTTTNTGIQTANFSNLQANTTYYVRGYASTNTTPITVVYGEVISFTTINNSLTDGLVLHLPFNGNARDESGRNNTVTLNGATLTTNRKNNLSSAYTFGNNRFISVNNSLALQFSNRFSYCVWIRLNSTTGIDGNGNTNQYGYHPIFTKDCDRNYLQSGISTALNNVFNYNLGTWTGSNQSNIPMSVGQWIFLSAVYNGSSISLYVNGQLVSTRAATIDFASTNNQALYIGKMNCFPYYFNGVIDDLRMYNRTLTQSEITQLYNE